MKQEHAEHVKAGRRDEAERIEQGLRGLTARLEDLNRRGPGRPDFQPPREGGRPGEGGPPRDELFNVLRELRQEVQNLRGEVSELREQVKRLSGGEGRR
jgi:hypothetical protein